MTAKEIGQRIASTRKRAGIPQEGLSVLIGVRLQTIRKWEKGMNIPRADRAVAVARALDVPVAWLITGEGESSSV